MFHLPETAIPIPFGPFLVRRSIKMIIKVSEEIWLIEQFLSAEECSNYINYSEYLGFQPADVDVHGVRKKIDQIRTNERADIESQEIAANLWHKLKLVTPPETWLSNAAGLSPFIRFYRYSGNQKFNLHKDGSKQHNGLRSRYTMLIYLNDIESGGETTFRVNDIKIKPEEGRCLFFAHDLWHSGTPVNGDEVKYVLRTDLMYA